MTLYSRLAAYYPCDNTHGRSLSEDVVGTNNATAGVASAATGKVRQGMFLLSSGGQFRSVPNDSAIQGLLGVCCWVKFSTLAADMSIVSKGDDATDANTSLKLWYDHSDTDLAFTVGDGATSTTVRTDGLTLAVDTWYHIRAYNDGNRMGIAVDGTLYASGTARAPLTDTGLLYLGSDFGTNYLDGTLDEVALFSTSPTVSDGAALYNGGSGASLPILDNLAGPSGRAGAGTRWLPPSYAESDDAVSYMAHGKMPVQRFDGSLSEAGIEAPDQKVTMASSGSGSLTGERFSYVRFLDAEGRVSNVSPLSDVHDTFGDATGSITGASNAAPIVITSTDHGLLTGETVRVTGQAGNTAANGTWVVTVQSTSTFALESSVGNGDWQASEDVVLRVAEKRAGSSGTSQVQTLSYSNTPTAGSFTLEFLGETSASIAYNASAATIQTALDGVTTIGSDNCVVAGGALPTAVTITFAEALANQDLPLLVPDFIGAPSTVSSTVSTTGSAGVNESQTISILNSPTGGTFTATIEGEASGNIAYNASAATVDTALEATSGVTSGDLTCTGGALPGTDVTVEFGGSLAKTNVAEITVDPSNLTGGPSIAISTPTPGAAATTFDLANASDDSVSGTPYYGCWTTDGKGFFSVGGRTATFYKASTAWDPSTFNAGNVVANNNLISGSFALAGSVCMSNDGTTVYIYFYTSTVSDIYWPAALLTFNHNYNPNTGNCGYLQSDGNEIVNGWGTNVYGGMCLGSNDTKFYYATTHLDRVRQYTMTTANDITTMSVDSSDEIDISSEISAPGGIAINDDGTEIYVAEGTTIYQYGLSTGYDGSTASYSSVTYVPGGTIVQLSVKPDGSKLFVTDGSGQNRHSFSSGGTDEVQRITVTGSPSEGTFTLTYDGNETAALDYDSTAAEIDTALEATSGLDAGDVTCSGGPLPGTAVDVTFTGNLAATNVDAITVDYDGLLWSVSTGTAGTKAKNEVASVSTDVPPGTGQFTLTFGGQTTDNIEWNATAAEMQEKFEALSTVGAGNCDLTGGPINLTAVSVEFTGTLSKQDVGAITASGNLTQTSPVLDVSVTTSGNDGVNEIQTITTSNASGGTFTLSSDADTTSSLAFDVTAAGLQEELEALSDFGNGTVNVTGGPLGVGAFEVEFIGSLGKTDVAILSTNTTSLLNGGWASGANKITYTEVDIPTSTNVTRRQILRSKPGAAGVFYIDVDEEDVTSNTFSSTKTDDELGSDVSVVMLDANGVDTNLSRHAAPPNYKRVVASYQNRMFYGVNYVERSMVTISGDTATGVGTDWPNAFDDRTIYQDSGHGVVAVDAGNQTAALTESTTTSQTAAEATIAQAAPDEQRLYHSWVTAEGSFPESVHPNQTFQVSRNSRDGAMTSEFVFDGKFYVAFKAAIYQYTFNQDPTPFPDGDGRMQLIVPRGAINNRCIAYTDDLAVMLDREGIFMFDGNTLDPASGQIKPVFTGTGTPAIQWKNQEWFHASYFATQRTVRFFVTLDGGPYPRHALCYNVDQKFWWVEEYPWPITSSTVGVVGGQSVVFLGSTGRRVFTLDGTRDGLAPSIAGTLRGTVTSSGSRTITDSTAAFDSGLVGSVLRIVEGTGRGQQRTITAATATSLTLKQHWHTRPSTDSVYQVSGVAWSVRTGKFQFTNNNQREVRRFEVFWEPTTGASHMDYQLYPDWSATAYVNKETRRAGSTDGVVTTKGNSFNKVDLAVRGHVEQEFGGNRPEGVSGEKFLAMAAEGVTNDEQLRLLGLAVAGSE